VVGIALNPLGLSDDEARAAIVDAREQTHLPVDDLVRFGPHAFYDAIAPAIQKTKVLQR